MIHATRKSMEQLGDKLEPGEKESIESAIKDVDEAMKSEDKDGIEAKTKALGEASAKMAERLYAEQQGDAAGSGAGAGPSASGGDSGSGGDRDDVVDAEFEEVKDDKK